MYSELILNEAKSILQSKEKSLVPRIAAICVIIFLSCVVLYLYNFSGETLGNVPNILEREFELVYLPTGEGLVSQFTELQNFWSNCKYTKRMRTVLHQSTHFYDSGYYSLCDIFKFDDKVTCLNITADQFITKGGGICVQKNVSSPHEWLLLPLSHGLSATSASKVLTVAELHVSNISCVLGGPSYVLGFKRGSSKLPIAFTEKYRYFNWEY